jgi:lipoprotein-anchoring transpeptidase ErfK/SrfK
MGMFKFKPMLFIFLLLISGLSANKALATSRRLNWPSSPYYNEGTIVIRARERAIYLVLNSREAIRYPVAVPKSGKEWSGNTRVAGKFLHPDWSPPHSVRRDHPELPSLIPGGDPHNPMGYAAITLERNEIAIHGTTQAMRRSIGSAASYGCIRMLNEDVADLFERVSVGTPVVME